MFEENFMQIRVRQLEYTTINLPTLLPSISLKNTGALWGAVYFLTYEVFQPFDLVKLSRLMAVSAYDTLSINRYLP